MEPIVFKFNKISRIYSTIIALVFVFVSLSCNTQPVPQSVNISTDVSLKKNSPVKNLDKKLFGTKGTSGSCVIKNAGGIYWSLDGLNFSYYYKQSSWLCDCTYWRKVTATLDTPLVKGHESSITGTVMVSVGRNYCSDPEQTYPISGSLKALDNGTVVLSLNSFQHTVPSDKYFYYNDAQGNQQSRTVCNPGYSVTMGLETHAGAARLYDSISVTSSEEPFTSETGTIFKVEPTNNDVSWTLKIKDQNGNVVGSGGGNGNKDVSFNSKDDSGNNLPNSLYTAEVNYSGCSENGSPATATVQLINPVPTATPSPSPTSVCGDGTVIPGVFNPDGSQACCPAGTVCGINGGGGTGTPPPTPTPYPTPTPGPTSTNTPVPTPGPTQTPGPTSQPTNNPTPQPTPTSLNSCEVPDSEVNGFQIQSAENQEKLNNIHKVADSLLKILEAEYPSSSFSVKANSDVIEQIKEIKDELKVIKSAVTTRAAKKAIKKVIKNVVTVGTRPSLFTLVLSVLSVLDEAIDLCQTAVSVYDLSTVINNLNDLLEEYEKLITKTKTKECLKNADQSVLNKIILELQGSVSVVSNNIRKLTQDIKDGKNTVDALNLTNATLSGLKNEIAQANTKVDDECDKCSDDYKKLIRLYDSIVVNIPIPSDITSINARRKYYATYLTSFGISGLEHSISKHGGTRDFSLLTPSHSKFYTDKILLKYAIKAYEFGRKNKYNSPGYISLGEAVGEYKTLTGGKISNLSIVEYGFGTTDKCSLPHIVPVTLIPPGSIVN